MKNYCIFEQMNSESIISDVVRNALFVAGIVVFGGHADAAPVTLDFEGFPDSTILATQYPGITFTNAIILTSGISLNEFEFPPHSGVNVVSDNAGPMTIDFSTPITSFGGYFTYLEPLTLNGSNARNKQVASATSLFSNNLACLAGPPCPGDPGSTPNELIQLTFTGGMSSVTITADPAGGSFTLDDATYTTASTISVPEPISVFLILIGTSGWFALSILRKLSMNQKQSLRGGAIAIIVLAIGGVWLCAQQAPYKKTLTTNAITNTSTRISELAPRAPSSVLLATTTTAFDANPASTSTATAITSHVIDSAGVDPSVIVSGSEQPVTFSADISDPALISDSINLIETKSGGSTVIIGSLQPAGDGAFALTTNLSKLPPGTFTFSISAAFSGQLKRSLAGIPFDVLPVMDTSAWMSVSGENFFTIKLPSEMHIANDPLSGGNYDTHTFDIQLSNGTTLAWVFVFTDQQWTSAQQIEGDGGTPTLLSQGPSFVCGYTLSENDANTLGFNEGDLQSELLQALATLQAH